MKEKKLSIIVPVYNVEKYLNSCVESIEKQTYKNIEILLVDDGSIDNSLKIARKLEKKYSNIKVIVQKNNGQGSARNNGLKQSSGDYISFIDSDDVVNENMFEVMLSLAIKNDLDIIECSYQEFCNNKKGFVYGSGAKCNEKYNGKDYYELHPILSPCNKIYNSSFLKKIDFKCTENRFAEDVYDISYLILKSNKIMRIEQCFYYYRRDNNNSTRNNSSIEHKVKLGVDKLFISNKLDKLRKELNSEGYISNIIIRNIFGVIFNKNFIFNKSYRKIVNSYLKEYNIKQIVKDNIKLRILFSLFITFLTKIIIKKD